MARLCIILVAVLSALALVKAQAPDFHDAEVPDSHEPQVQPVPGKGGKRAAKRCARTIKKFEGCLKQGYKSENCVSGEGSLKKYRLKKCDKVAKRVKKCDYACKKPEPEPEPEPKPEPEPETEPEPDNSCQRAMVRFMGADIFSMTMDNFEQCADSCRKISGCQSITFDKWQNLCEFKARRGGEKGPSYDTGGSFISMNIPCYPGFDATNRTCIEEGVLFEGAELSDSYSLGYESCRTMCFDTPDCVAFSLEEATNRCFLGYKRGGEWPVHVAGYYSANMEC